MKCCSCKKEVDLNDREVPPKWYGRHSFSEIVKVICADCIKTEEGRKEYDKRD
jgi:hypothetical protein